MKREHISEEQYLRILDCFISAIMQNGLKATTMDSIAASLQMSKRTLYEIFSTKDELFKEAYSHFNKRMGEKLAEIFKSSANVMEAIIKCFLFNRDFMSKLSADFVRDIQEYAKNNHMNTSERNQHYQNLYDILQKGVNEGYFRDDSNMMVQCKLLTLQMEAVKHTEKFFPEDVSPLEVYDSIITSFLRGISSTKGLLELEKYMPSSTEKLHDENN